VKANELIETGDGAALKSWVGGTVWPWLLLCALMLLPFLGKPAHIDDPLFLWEARQIQAHPFDPFGFDVNWYGFVQPIHEVTCNPPLASYCLALVATVFGWHEAAFHLAFMVPALLAVFGTWKLARRWTRSPALAAAALLACPTFLVSASTLMCDVLMLAFFVWALVFWVRGTDEDNRGWLALGALCALGAILSKYSGVTVIGLMGLYSAWCRSRPGWATKRGATRRTDTASSSMRHRPRKSAGGRARARSSCAPS